MDATPESLDIMTLIISMIFTLIPFIMFGVVLLIQLAAVTLGLIGMVLWICMLVDVAQRDFPNPNDKLLWVLVLVFAQAIGAVVYYFAVKRVKKRQVEAFCY